MKKIISLLLLLFLLVGMVPSPGFCEDKNKDNATAGAAIAGSTAGEETTLGFNARTIGLGVAIIAIIAYIIIASGGDSETATHH